MLSSGKHTRVPTLDPTLYETYCSPTQIPFPCSADYGPLFAHARHETLTLSVTPFSDWEFIMFRTVNYAGWNSWVFIFQIPASLFAHTRR